jgi:hypothetical protein
VLRSRVGETLPPLAESLQRLVARGRDVREDQRRMDVPLSRRRFPREDARISPEYDPRCIISSAFVLESTQCFPRGDSAHDHRRQKRCYPKAFLEMKAAGALLDACELRRSKYLNNRVEQDHRCKRQGDSGSSHGMRDEMHLSSTLA